MNVALERRRRKPRLVRPLSTHARGPESGLHGPDAVLLKKLGERQVMHHRHPDGVLHSVIQPAWVDKEDAEATVRDHQHWRVVLAWKASEKAFTCKVVFMADAVARVPTCSSHGLKCVHTSVQGP